MQVNLAPVMFRKSVSMCRTGWQIPRIFTCVATSAVGVLVLVLAMEKRKSIPSSTSD